MAKFFFYFGLMVICCEKDDLGSIKNKHWHVLFGDTPLGLAATGVLKVVVYIVKCQWIKNKHVCVEMYGVACSSCTIG